MELKGYWSDETLDEWLEQGKITKFDFCTHLTPYDTEKFKEFCEKNGLGFNEEGAEAYYKYLNTLVNRHE